MGKVFGTSFRNGDDEYQLSVEFSTDEFIEGDSNFKFFIQHINHESGRNSEPVEFKVSVRPGDEGEPELVVSNRNQELLVLPLDEVFSAEGVIEMIPGWLYGGGDIITGCLIRSGLSVSIGQIIKCKKATEGKSGWQRVWSIMKCLKQNFSSVCGRVAIRAAKCVVKMGF